MFIYDLIPTLPYFIDTIVANNMRMVIKNISFYV